MPDLAGARVLVTRPSHQAAPLMRLIEQAGGSALHFPAVEIAQPQDSALLQGAIARLDTFDLAVFVSPNAVSRTLNQVKACREWPSRVAIACVGKGSAREIERFGLRATLVPTGRFDSEALLDMPALQDMTNRRVVIFRGDGGRELLGETLKARGAEVEYVECYRRVRPTGDIAPLLRALARGEIDVVTLTTTEGLRNLFDLLGKAGQQWLVRTPAIVVSERLATACRELGFRHEPIVTRTTSDDAMIEALLTWRASQKPL